MAAALVAYLRAVPSTWQTQLVEPVNIIKLVELLHRRFYVQNPGKYYDASTWKPVIWNGQVGDKNCLTDYATAKGDTGWDKNGDCPTTDIGTTPETGIQPVGTCVAPPAAPVPRGLKARQDSGGGSCPLNPNGGGGDLTVTYSKGPMPTPTCASGTGCGGVLCTGYYCSPYDPASGPPPGYQDPNDPNAGNPVPTTTIGGGSPPSGTPDCDDACKLDRGNPCTCDESGCDANSPSCCGNASCPLCNCDESGCDAGSPSCCASDTCQWSWTGGGGGDGSGQPPGGSQTSSTSTSTPTTTPPAPASGFVVFAFSEQYIPSPIVLPNNPIRQWDVFSVAAGSQLDMCGTSPVTIGDAGGATGANPGFPPNFPDFDTVAGKCHYDGTTSAIGTLTCAAGQATTCDPQDVGVDCGSGATVAAAVLCRW
jgi:hypothetical protein